MDFKCTQCNECCKRYWITLLPQELKKAAEFLNLSEEEFIEKHTQLYIQLYPLAYREHALVYSSSFLPRKICEKIENHLNYLPESFLVMPMLALKRNEKICTLLIERKGCKIHEVKPTQCTLFPFLSLEEKPNFRELYTYCEGLKNSDKDSKEHYSDEHYSAIKAYFKNVKEKGFAAQWKSLPEKGLVVFKGLEVCEIALSELKHFLV